MKEKKGTIRSGPLSPASNVRGLQLARMFLANNLTYFLARLALGPLGRRLRPYQEAAVQGILSELHAAYSGEKPVIFASAFVPTELIYGLGAIPVLPEVWSGFAAAAGFSAPAVTASEAAGYSQDLCSFHRCSLGLENLELLPKPAAVIVSSHLCDGGRRSLYRHSRSFGCPFYVLDVPYAATPDGVAWLAHQIERVARDLVVKVPGLSLAGLPRALAAANRARTEYLAVCRLRRERPAPWAGSEALNYVAVFLSGWGSSWLPEFYAQLRCYLEEAIRRSAFPVPQERHRLLWLNLRPYYATPLFTCLEKECNTSTAFEEYSHLYWPAHTPEAWAESLAAKLLAHFGWGPIERRLETVWSLVQEYGIDGVVQFNQWGCRQSNGGGRFLADFLRTRGIPFLELAGDGVDGRSSGAAQQLTRIAAFVELLEARNTLSPGRRMEAITRQNEVHDHAGSRH